MHGDKPTGIDAGIYGFIANIYFYDIDTPLKQFVVAHDNIVRHCRAIHEAVSCVGWAKARKRRAHHDLANRHMVGALSLCPPYALQ